MIAMILIEAQNIFVLNQSLILAFIEFACLCQEINLCVEGWLQSQNAK